jgi:phospholipid/cholesterol/gamma-HCH transport system substrate-binding protein
MAGPGLQADNDPGGPVRRIALIAVILVGAGVTLGSGAVGSSSGSTPVYLIRAIFDNAAFAVPGEDVRIAGATVGSIQNLSVVTGAGGVKQAAVTIAVDAPSFTPFHQDATCAIRPQSLIGEKYVDCLPGSSHFPPLPKITQGPGAGSYYLPVTRTSSPVDSDISQDIYQEPLRQRLTIILNELGTGLGAQGTNLNAVIRRANPALGQTDKVLQILARQNKQLAQLATDSNAVLTPLKHVKHAIADFIVQANTTATATAARAADSARSIQLFPQFLRALNPLLTQLGHLADQGTPLMSSLAQSASALGRQFQNLAPFATVGRPALIALGHYSALSQPNLVGTLPLAKQLLKLGQTAQSPATNLKKLLQSLNNTGAIEQLMNLLFYGVSAANGFDKYGHYVRTEPQVGQCTAYKKTPISDCLATWNAPGAGSADAPHGPVIADAASAAAAHAARATSVTRPQAIASLLQYLIGSKS